MARGGVRALARARRGRGGRPGRRHRRQPRLRLWWDRRVFERLPWTYLRDAEATLAGARIYGSPWCPRRRVRPKADEPQPPSPPLPPGATRAALAAARARRRLHGGRRGRARSSASRRFPTASTSCVTHTPPLGHGDLHGDRRPRRLDARCVAAIERVQPALAVFGHIHEGRGEPTRAGRDAVRQLGDLRPLVRAPQPAVAGRRRPRGALGRARRVDADCDRLVNTH